MDEGRSNKSKWIRRQFQTSGVQLEPAALNRLIDIIDLVDNPKALIQNVLDEIENGLGQRRVTLELLEPLIADLEGEPDAANATTSSSGVVQVINAVDAPYILYDPIRKLFRKVNEPRRLHGDAKSKLQLYVDRYLLLQQRIKRNKMFRPAQWTSLGGRATTGDATELTELKALLGLIGERRFVLGFLTRQDQDRYFLEDLSTRLPLDLSGTDTADGLFTENCIVVVEGELTTAGTFKAVALGLPPSEDRNESIKAMQGLDCFGGKTLDARQEAKWRESSDNDHDVVVLSDVWLDRPDVLEKLQLIFQGYSSVETPPSGFVLMGNFQTYDANSASTHYGRLRDNFAALGRLINSYPAIRATSQFLIVPGPGDVGPGATLPRPPIPRSIVGPLIDAVPNTVLCSNPCRVRHGASDIVFFRDNIQHKMRGLSLLPDAVGKEEVSLFDRVCATVIQEGHLCPVPLEFQPIYWEYDHAMSLYPTPHAIVLADSEPNNLYTYFPESEQQGVEGGSNDKKNGCVCINPGSLANGAFTSWNPVSNEATICDAIEPGDEEYEEAEEEDNDGAGAHDEEMVEV